MKRTSAVLALVGVLALVPIVLLKLGGSPAIPSFDGVRVTDTYIPLDPVLQVVALLAWIVWGYVASAALLRVVAVGVGGRSGSLLSASGMLTPRPLRLWVDFAIGGVLLAATINLRGGGNVNQASYALTTTAVSETSKRDVAHGVSKAKSETSAYRVRDGDSLWRIAERKLGSGFRWREIFDQNRGKNFGTHVQALTDPRLIRPGWILEVPNPVARHQETHPPPAPRRSRLHQLRPSKPAVPHDAMKPAHQSPVPARPTTQLPSGLVVATSFASGLLTAEFLSLLKRRRRFKPLVDSVEQPTDSDSDLVRELRESSAAPGPSILAAALEALTSLWRERFNEKPPLVGAHEHDRRVLFFLADSGVQVPSEVGGSISPRITFCARPGRIEAEVTGPFAPHLHATGSAAEECELVPACRGSDGSVLHLAPFGLGVLSVEGPSAQGMVLQMILAAALQAAHADLELILLGVTDELGALETLPQVTRSVAWDDATEALHEIQSEFLRRARLFFQEGVDDSRAHEVRRPEERLRKMLIVAGEPPAALRGIVEAVAVEVNKFGAGLVALEWKPNGTRFHANAGDRVVVESEAVHVERGLVPLVTDVSAARQAADTIRIAHAEELADVFEPSEMVESHHQVPPPRSSPNQEQEGMVHVAPVRLESALSWTVASHASAESDVPCPEIRCLGAIIIARSDGSIPVKGWRTPAKEMLVYLAMHSDGAHKERLAELFLPGVPVKKAVDLVARAASIIRTRVRGPGDERRYVELEGETWRLERGAWRSDAWDFERLIIEAQHAGRDEGITRLRVALALYRGEFCDDAYFPWAQQARERYRALFLRGSAQLAERIGDAGEYEDALATLDRAIEIEPLCEDLYRRAMLIEASLTRHEEALGRYEGLRRVLARDLNCNPAPETEQLARDLERIRDREPARI